MGSNWKERAADMELCPYVIEKIEQGERRL